LENVFKNDKQERDETGEQDDEQERYDQYRKSGHLDRFSIITDFEKGIFSSVCPEFHNHQRLRILALSDLFLPQPNPHFAHLPAISMPTKAMSTLIA
jgi:hypothetical protein